MRKPKTMKLSALMRKFVIDKDPDGSMYQLSKLWGQWPEVVGEHIAELAFPLKHRKTALVLGVEDSMVMQELGYYSPVILEQVNEFLGMNFFDKVQLELIRDRVPLNTPRDPARAISGPPLKKPRDLGGLESKLDPDSPVGKAYLAYLRLFEERNGASGNDA